MRIPYPTFVYEAKCWNDGHTLVAGLDEVGRGAFAGPVVAAAVIFRPHSKAFKGVHDSKLLTAAQRRKLAPLIRGRAVSYAIAQVDLPYINRYGVGLACQCAFRKALQQLRVRPQFHLIDAFYIERVGKKLQQPIIKGDQKSLTIAAASIIAKCYRDNLMHQLHKQYPQYNFRHNVGYGTREHRAAIKKYGLSPLHRRSFDLKKYLSATIE